MAEGGGLLNRYTVKSCIGGSNPPLSARNSFKEFTAEDVKDAGGNSCAETLWRPYMSKKEAPPRFERRRPLVLRITS